MFDNGYVVIGVIYENDIGFDYCVIVGGLYEVFYKVLVVVFGLENVIMFEMRVGFRLFILGFLFVIGLLFNFEGIFVVNGLGVLGLIVGLYLGVEFVKLVFG